MSRLERYLARHVTRAHVHRVLKYLAASCCPVRYRSECALRDAQFEAAEFMRVHIAENRSVPRRSITHMRITARDKADLEIAMMHAANTLNDWYRSQTTLWAQQTQEK